MCSKTAKTLAYGDENSVPQFSHSAKVGEVLWVWSSRHYDLLGHLCLVLCLDVEVELTNNKSLFDKDPYPV